MTLTTWHFCEENGTFELAAPHASRYLYFPLLNESGLVSSVSPTLHGDIKTNQNTFLLAPVSVEDLHTSRSSRNFWVNVQDYGAWSVTGTSARQIAQHSEEVKLRAGFLWHTLGRTNFTLGLRAVVTNFVPANHDQVELMRVTLTNVSDRALTLVPTAAIPLYGRSADNLRDHRHVTSLLQRTRTQRYGVLVKPTLSFDERGHQPNNITYAVLGVEEDGTPPSEFFPVIEDFIGEGGTLDWPEAVVDNKPGVGVDVAVDGYESIGGLRFASITLAPGQSQSYVLVLSILNESTAASGVEASAGNLADQTNRLTPRLQTVGELIEHYGSAAKFDRALVDTQAYWSQKLATLHFHTDDPRFDQWLKWVTLQPILRRIAGNSWLPYHDYGRGGRGWRDLWQDSLALLMTETGDVSELLFGNFAGVRFDGSNATIIGSAPGEFKADRNNIPRVWMDHGAWPLLTTKLYIDQTGDLAFLLREQTYFKDHLIYRTQRRDEEWQAEQGTQQLTTNGAVYRGTVLEHLLLQHLTPFFNVGEHNIIRLEGADWNDALDMARTRGESVAFTALYAGNFKQLGELVLALEKLDIAEVEIAAELLPLLDTLQHAVDYNSVTAKHDRLNAYFESVRHSVSGQKVRVRLTDLANDLHRKAAWMFEHLRQQEWISNQDGFAWFNGYYDDAGQRVEGDHATGMRMTLTGQVFTLMGGIATDEQARAIVRAADRYLYEPKMGGYRLNTDFGAVLLKLGRCFGFAFGHKENGAMFSHMAVMYANALYQRGFIAEGFKVLNELYQHCQNFEVSRIYPGLPEYISARGRGMYPYLTGSASWYLLTLITEVFGVKGALGDLVLSPKLLATQFDAQQQCGLKTSFAGRPIEVGYHNPARLDYGAYQIEAIAIDGVAVKFDRIGWAARIEQAVLAALDPDRTHTLDVTLGDRS